MGAKSQPQRGEPSPNVLCSKHPDSGVQIRQPGQLNLPTVGHQPVNQTPFWPILLVWPLQVFIYDIYHTEVLKRGLGQRPQPGFQTSASGYSAGSLHVWSTLFQLASQKGILQSLYYCCWGIVSQQRAGTRNKKIFSTVNHPSAMSGFLFHSWFIPSLLSERCCTHARTILAPDSLLTAENWMVGSRFSHRPP